MAVCEKWLEGTCKLGKRCPFVHGKAKVRFFKESDERLAEERETWGGRRPAQPKEGEGPSQLVMWSERLSQMQPGETLRFDDLSPEERHCLHDVATSLQFEHITCGDWSRSTLEIRRPPGGPVKRPDMHLEQCLSFPPEDVDDVSKMLKQVLSFYQLSKDHKDRKKAMEKEITRAAKGAFCVLTSKAQSGSGGAFHSISDRDSIVKDLANLKIQKFELEGNLLGNKLASDLYDFAFVGDRDNAAEVIVDVEHSEPAAPSGQDTTECLNRAHDNMPAPDMGSREGYHDAADEVSQSTAATKIYVLQFKRKQQPLFCCALEESTGLHECCKTMEMAGLDWNANELGYVFLTPQQHREVFRILKVMDLVRRPYTVIISEQYKPFLEEVFAQIPYRKRPKEDAGRRRFFEVDDLADGEDQPAEKADAVSAAAGMVTDLNAADEHPETLPYGLKIVRTFLCVVPLLIDGASVVQSTTEAMTEASQYHYKHTRGLNPRRVIATE